MTEIEDEMKSYFDRLISRDIAETLVKFIPVHLILPPGFSKEAHSSINTKSSDFSGIFKNSLFIIGSSCVLLPVFVLAPPTPTSLWTAGGVGSLPPE